MKLRTTARERHICHIVSTREREVATIISHGGSHAALRNREFE